MSNGPFHCNLRCLARKHLQRKAVTKKKTTLFKFQNDAGIPYSAGVYFIEAMWLLRSSKIPFVCLSASLILKAEV